MSHEQPDMIPAEVAALYLAGALSEQERERFEADLRSGHAEDEGCRSELRRLEGVVETLAAAAGEVAPDPSVRKAILEAAAGGGSGAAAGATQGDDSQVWRTWESTTAAASLYTLYAADGEWEETGVHGVRVRRLFVDREANRMTAMFRMAPGAAYVPHVHDAPEECYVLEGDLHVGDIVMRAGDYQRAPAGSHHGRQWTERGCLLLVTCSLSDELE